SNAVVCRETSASRDIDPVADRVARINDEALPLGESTDDFSLETVALAQLDGTANGTAVLNHVDRPVTFVAEEAARRHLQDGLACRHDDADLDAVAGADVRAAFGWLGEIDDDVHVVLPDAPGSGLREAGG